MAQAKTKTTAQNTNRVTIAQIADAWADVVNAQGAFDSAKETLRTATVTMLARAVSFAIDDGFADVIRTGGKNWGGKKCNVGSKGFRDALVNDYGLAADSAKNIADGAAFALRTHKELLADGEGGRISDEDIHAFLSDYVSATVSVTNDEGKTTEKTVSGLLASLKRVDADSVEYWYGSLRAIRRQIKAASGRSETKATSSGPRSPKEKLEETLKGDITDGDLDALFQTIAAECIGRDPEHAVALAQGMLQAAQAEAAKAAADAA